MPSQQIGMGQQQMGQPQMSMGQQGQMSMGQQQMGMGQQQMGIGQHTSVIVTGATYCCVEKGAAGGSDNVRALNTLSYWEVCSIRC